MNATLKNTVYVFVSRFSLDILNTNFTDKNLLGPDGASGNEIYYMTIKNNMKTY